MAPLTEQLVSSLAQQPLPIVEVMGAVSRALQAHQVVLLQAPPGAGKSTLLPLWLLAQPWLAGQNILVLQPRRLAARMVATRLAGLSEEPLGQLVGYKVRFEQQVSQATRLTVLTEGVFTRQLMQQPELEGIGLVIFDEFHERSLQADLAFALCREVQEVLRPDLKVLIMSATLETEGITKALETTVGHVPVITSEGKAHPLTVLYEPLPSGVSQSSPLPVFAQAIARAVKQSMSQHEGHVLVFLPGQREIKAVQDMLEPQDLQPDASINKLVVLPLYADLPMEAQQQALAPVQAGLRKVILATSIAETSLTIEGVRLVIDSGYARQQRFEPRTGMSAMETVRVTHAAAAQRAGRAARQGPGVAIRLWAAAQQGQLLPQRQPEITKAELGGLVLETARWSSASATSLPWLTTPPPGNWAAAMGMLTGLGLLAADKLTTSGKLAAGYPTHPRLATMLAGAKALQLAALAADVAAVLEERDFLPPNSGADVSLRVEALVAWRNQGESGRPPMAAERNSLQRASRLSAQWRRLLNVQPLNSMPDPFDVGRLVALAYPDRVAQQQKPNGEAFKIVRSKQASLPQHDPLTSYQWLAVAHLDASVGHIYEAAPLNPEHLQDRWTERQHLALDQQQGRVVAETQVVIGDLVVKRKPSEMPKPEQLQALWVDFFKANGLASLDWSLAAKQWIARVSCLRVWLPAGEAELWPAVDIEALLASMEHWLLPFVDAITKVDQLAKLDVHTMLEQLLTYAQQQQLAQLLPTHILVPSGSRIALEYQQDGSKPVLAVRLQELFGLRDTPTVLNGKQAVLLHLLSPGYKPVQVTQDLPSFWDNTYPEVKKELKRRYPKHAWPDDPWTAAAVRGVQRKPAS